MKANDIMKILDDWAEQKLVDSWDNTGFQIGNDDLDIKKILIALDLDENVLEKAINEGFQMIVTHHPIIFKPLKSINNRSYLGSLILRIITNNIVVYNAHSNLDLAIGGVNDELANILQLTNTKPLNNIVQDKFDEDYYGYGRVGDIDEIDTIDFLYRVKESLCLNDLRVYGNINKKISKIAVCGGSGGEFIHDAYKNGADLYISGDIKYHEAQQGLQLGMIIVDAGHYHTEKVILPVIKKILLHGSKSELCIEVFKETAVAYKIY